MPGSPNVPQSPALLSLEPSWMMLLRAENKSERTIKTYRNGLERFCAWLSADHKAEHCTTTLAEVTQDTCIRFMSWLLTNRSGNTAYTSHVALSSFFHFCLEFGEIEAEADNPMRRVKLPNVTIRETPILTKEQIRALLATCENGKTYKDKRIYAIIRVFMATGLRLSELTDLELGDLRLEAGIIHVRHGKGDKHRDVAMGARTALAVNKYLHVRIRQNHGTLSALWIGTQGALTSRSIAVLIARQATQAGIEGLHPHMFRHGFAHYFLAADGDILELATLGGWEKLEMIQKRYGAALANERAIAGHHRLRIAEDW